MRILYNETQRFYLDTIAKVYTMLLNEMEIFYHVVEQQSFSKAAKRLGVSKSFVSKKINKLEAALQVRLLTRNTRKLTLTEAGEGFYHYCANVVQQGREGYAMIRELQGDPAGQLKISIPPALGLNLLQPVLTEFLTLYPNVTLDIRLESHLVDLVKQGYDLALRSAQLASSNLIAQRIFTIRDVICASANYLAKYGKITKPADLSEHNFAYYSGSKQPGKVQLIKQQHEEVVAITGNIICNQLDLAKQMVLNHTCLAILPQFMVNNELKTGKLTLCLADYLLPESHLFAIYPEKEFMLPKLRCFLAILKKQLAHYY